MKRKSDDSKKVMENLLEAIEAEAHLCAMYHLDHRYLKYIKFCDHKHLSEFSCEVEDFMQQFIRLLFMMNGTVQYDSGTLTSQDPGKPPSETVIAIYEQALLMEKDIAEKSEEWCINAWEAKLDEPRNVWEHSIKMHNCHINWLSAQIRWANDLGPKDFLAPKLG